MARLAACSLPHPGGLYHHARGIVGLKGCRRGGGVAAAGTTVSMVSSRLNTVLFSKTSATAQLPMRSTEWNTDHHDQPGREELQQLRGGETPAIGIGSHHEESAATRMGAAVEAGFEGRPPAW